MATEVTQGSNPILDFAAAKGEANRRSAENANQVERNNDTITNATQQDITAVENAASADQIVKAATDAAQLRTSADNAQAKVDLGLDRTKANYRLANLASQQADAYDKANAIAKVIADKQSATILSDPLGFINAQFTLPADIAQHNYYAGLHNSAASEYDSIVSQGTATAVENKALEATMTVAQAQADQDKIAAMSSKQTAEITKQGAQLNTQGIQALQSIQQGQLNNAHLAVSVADAQSRIQMQRAQFEAAQTNRALQQSMLVDRLNERKATIDEQNMTADNYNKAAARLGGATLPASIILARLKKGDPVVSQFVRYGEDISINGDKAEGVIVATNPAQAGALYGSSKIIPSGTTASVMNYLASQVNSLASDQQVQGEKDGAGKMAVMNAKINGDVARQSSLISDSEPNIYAAPSIAAVVGSVPALVNNGFVSGELMAKSKANPDMASSAKDIFAAGVVAIKSDPSRLDEVAAGISQFYSGAVHANNALKGYAENGLPTQKSYPAELPTGILGRNQTLDMTNPALVTRALMFKSLTATGSMGKLMANKRHYNTDMPR
jgi:hypothetical protein